MSCIGRNVRCATLIALGVAAGCKSTKPASTAAQLVGLAAVPATVDVVISVDVAQTASAPLVQRAATQLLLRDATLAARWQQLQTICKIEPDSISQVVLAFGNSSAVPNVPPTRAVLMVVTGGSLSEANFASCVKGFVGKGGGTLTAKPASGRTVYYAKEGDRGLWFGFGAAHTIVIGSTESIVIDALSSGPKLTSNPEFVQWMSMASNGADHGANQRTLGSGAIWAVGRVDPRVSEGLVRASGGKLTSGPAAFVLSAAMSTGFQATLAVIMKQSEDAKGLELLAKNELPLLAMAAQWKNLGPLASKLTTLVKNSTVEFSVTWTDDDLNQLLSVIDSAPPSKETAAPAGATPSPALK